MRIFFPYQQEEDAKSNEDHVRAQLEKALDDGVKLENVEVDGLFIIVTATGAWDDYWMNSYADPY